MPSRAQQPRRDRAQQPRRAWLTTRNKVYGGVAAVAALAVASEAVRLRSRVKRAEAHSAWLEERADACLAMHTQASQAVRNLTIAVTDIQSIQQAFLRAMQVTAEDLRGLEGDEAIAALLRRRVTQAAVEVCSRPEMVREIREAVAGQADHFEVSQCFTKWVVPYRHFRLIVVVFVALLLGVVCFVVKQRAVQETLKAVGDVAEVVHDTTAVTKEVEQAAQEALRHPVRAVQALLRPT